jgi:hypothetical protein
MYGQLITCREGKWYKYGPRSILGFSLEGSTYLSNKILANLVVFTVACGVKEEVFVGISIEFNCCVINYCTSEIGEVVCKAHGKASISLIAERLNLLVLRVVMENSTRGTHADDHEQEAYQTLNKIQTHMLWQVLFKESEKWVKLGATYISLVISLLCFRCC